MSKLLSVCVEGVKSTLLYGRKFDVDIAIIVLVEVRVQSVGVLQMW